MGPLFSQKNNCSKRQYHTSIILALRKQKQDCIPGWSTSHMPHQIELPSEALSQKERRKGRKKTIACSTVSLYVTKSLKTPVKYWSFYTVNFSSKEWFKPVLFCGIHRLFSVIMIYLWLLSKVDMLGYQFFSPSLLILKNKSFNISS